MVVELQYTTFGSNHRNEDIAVRLETEFNTVNVMLGYSLRIGDAWDGVRRFRVMAGPRFHSVQKARLGSMTDKDQVKSSFLSLHIGAGMLLTENLLLDVRYNHALSDILEIEIPEIESLTPYYVALGVTYYLYR